MLRKIDTAAASKIPLESVTRLISSCAQLSGDAYVFTRSVTLLSSTGVVLAQGEEPFACWWLIEVGGANPVMHVEQPASLVTLDGLLPTSARANTCSDGGSRFPISVSHPCSVAVIEDVGYVDKEYSIPETFSITDAQIAQAKRYDVCRHQSLLSVTHVDHPTPNWTINSVQVTDPFDPGTGSVLGELWSFKKRPVDAAHFPFVGHSGGVLVDPVDQGYDHWDDYLAAYDFMGDVPGTPSVGGTYDDPPTWPGQFRFSRIYDSVAAGQGLMISAVVRGAEGGYADSNVAAYEHDRPTIYLAIVGERANGKTDLILVGPIFQGVGRYEERNWSFALSPKFFETYPGSVNVRKPVIGFFSPQTEIGVRVSTPSTYYSTIFATAYPIANHKTLADAGRGGEDLIGRLEGHSNA